MGYCFLGYEPHKHGIRHQFVHVTHFDQSESSKGFACLDSRPRAVELTEIVCARVNLKLRPSPCAWVAIYPKKQGVE